VTFEVAVEKVQEAPQGSVIVSIADPRAMVTLVEN
jgi:hypothetical protein